MIRSRRVRLMISWLMELRRSMMPAVTVGRTSSVGTRWGVTSTRVEAMYCRGAKTAQRIAAVQMTTKGMMK